MTLQRPLLLAAVLCSACVGALAGAGAAWAVYHRYGPASTTITTVQPGDSRTSGGTTFADLAAAAAPSLVKIVTQPLTPAQLLGGGPGLVDGFVASRDGLVVTSAHALQGATQLRVAFADGHVEDAVVAASDVAHGVAVLRVHDQHGAPPLDLADGAHQPRPGDLAVVVSSPPLAALAVTSGTVSTTSRTVTLDTTAGGHSLAGAMVLNAAAARDDDGAPVLDASGRVVGVVVAADTPVGGVVAAGGRSAAALLDGLSRGAVSGPTFGLLAVIVDPATAAAVGVQPGALVTAVAPGGPADVAGLQTADVVTTVDTTAIDSDHPLEPGSLGLAVGQRVILTVLRGGQTLHLTLTVGG